MKKCIAFAIGLIISGLMVVGLTFDGCFNSHKQTSRVVPDSCLGQFKYRNAEHSGETWKSHECEFVGYCDASGKLNLNQSKPLCEQENYALYKCPHHFWHFDALVEEKCNWQMIQKLPPVECEFVADKELLDEKINDPNFAGWSASGYLSVQMHHDENEFAVKSFVEKIVIVSVPGRCMRTGNLGSLEDASAYHNISAKNEDRIEGRTDSCTIKETTNGVIRCGNKVTVVRKCVKKHRVPGGKLNYKGWNKVKDFFAENKTKAELDALMKSLNDDANWEEVECDFKIEKEVVLPHLGNPIPSTSQDHCGGVPIVYNCSKCNEKMFENPLPGHVGPIKKTKNRKEATCVEDGHTEEWTCKSCNGILIESSTIPKDENNHPKGSLQMKPKVEPTCSEDGHSKYEHCYECEKDIGKVVIPKDPNNHVWTRWVPEENAKCGDLAKMVRFCKKCNKKDEKEQPEIVPHIPTL